jgi:hypothetical protein
MRRNRQACSQEDPRAETRASGLRVRDTGPCLPWGRSAAATHLGSPNEDRLWTARQCAPGSLSSSKRGNAWVCAMTDDEKAIRDLIARQFGSLNWRPGTSGDWNAFTSDFPLGAPLYAGRRHVRPYHLLHTPLLSRSSSATSRRRSVRGHPDAFTRPAAQP